MTSSLIKNQHNQVRELIDSAASIGVIIGDAQNVDSVAAALSIYLILETYGKNVQIISKKQPTVEVSNLVGIDRVADGFSGVAKTLTISVPYREGEIEKVSYNIEGDRLNVNLFAEENGITFSERDVEYIRKGSSPDLIITVGVTNDEDIKGFVDVSNVKIINIDRNPLNTATGDVSLIDPSFSSLSEVVTSIAMDMNFPADVDAYQNLMDGIVSSTNNFTAPATSGFAFEAAGFLLQNGAKRKQIEVTQPRRDTFPKEDLFLNTNPRPQNQPKASRPVQNFPRPQGQNQNKPFPRPQAGPVQTAPLATPAPMSASNNQNPNVQTPSKPFSAPKEMASETQDMPDEAQFTEGGMGSEIPDDWFLPKVFKGSKKGN